MKTGVKVADAMTRNPIVIAKELSLRECANSMIRNHVGSVIVKQHNKLLGLVTAKDFVNAVQKNVDFDKVTVGDIMIKKIKTITPDVDIYDALLDMSKKDIRRLPVIHKNELLGLLTISDVLKLQPRLLDVLAEKVKIGGLFRRKSLNPFDGECEVCGNFTKLYEVKTSKFMCESCRGK